MPLSEEHIMEKFDNMKEHITEILTELGAIKRSQDEMKATIVELKTQEDSRRKSFFQDPRMWLPLIALALSITGNAGWITTKDSSQGKDFMEQYIRLLEMRQPEKEVKTPEFPRVVVEKDTTQPRAPKP